MDKVELKACRKSQRHSRRVCVEHFLSPAVVAEHSRNANDLPHPFRMVERLLQCDAAHAVADQIHAWNFVVIEDLHHTPMSIRIPWGSVSYLGSRERYVQGDPA
jgi:hypothetical protein